MRSRWIGPFIVKNVFHHGTIEIENPKNSNIFKVNGQCLKLFLENFSQEEESIMLGSKTLGTKCIRTSICNALANHDQNIEPRFRLAQSVLICKIGIK